MVSEGTADAIPVATTPPGGYGPTFPPPVLAGCTELLAEGAPDLRGVWRVTEAVRGGMPVADDDPILAHVERIEQCGDRVVVTGGGVIHDMRADGSVARGVHDVAAATGTPIEVVATFEDGVHVLRPVGLDGVEVTRRRAGDAMVWSYAGLFTARLERIGGPDDAPSVPTGPGRVPIPDV